MTITLDAGNAEILKAIMKKEGKYDGKKDLPGKIKSIYEELIIHLTI